jgi:hypothetical protein
MPTDVFWEVKGLLYTHKSWLLIVISKVINYYGFMIYSKKPRVSENAPAGSDGE